MKLQPQSTKFAFVLNNEQTMNNIDHLKMVDYPKFKEVNHIGTLLAAAAKEDNITTLDALTEKHRNLIPFLKLQIEDAFLSALHLRNIDIVKYFLENGFDINSVAEDAPLTVCYALQYLKGEQQPIDLLSLVLSYGSNARKASDRDSETALHLAAQYGSVSFMKLLLEYGADINAVSDDRQTPLGVAIRFKMQNAATYLKEKGGSEHWNA